MNGKVEAEYYLTYGALGNIAENQFGTPIPTILTDKYNDISISNVYSASGGSDYETFDMLKQHIPLSIKTLGVAITREDYEAIAKLVPGVDKSYVDYQ